VAGIHVQPVCYKPSQYVHAWKTNIVASKSMGPKTQQDTAHLPYAAPSLDQVLFPTHVTHSLQSTTPWQDHASATL
jgi:hypothetical protein